ncbi:MAG: hypothetical protein WBA07_13340, partial [Rivularia sp. (in: cyanobacteria)]
AEGGFGGGQGGFGGGQSGFGGGQGGFGGGQGGFGGGQPDAEDEKGDAEGGESPMGGGGAMSPFAQLRVNLDNYFKSDDFKEGKQPGNLNPFSQPPSGGAGGPSGGGAGGEGGGNPFGGNPFEYDPISGGDNSDKDDSDDKDNPMMGGDNSFGDVKDADTDSDNLFADFDNLSESFSDNFEAGKAQYESFSDLFNEFEASTDTDTEGDELAPLQFTNFLNTLSESDIELPEDSSITNLSQFSDLASSFSKLSASNAEAFIETFADVDFTGGSGNPFSEGNPFAGEDNPFTQITEIFAVEDTSAV